MEKTKFTTSEEKINHHRKNALDSTTRALKYVTVHHDYSKERHLPYLGELELARMHLREAVLCLANEAGQDNTERIRKILERYEMEKYM